MYIVQGKNGDDMGGILVVKDTRPEALATAIDLIDHGLPAVVIIDADGRVHSTQAFAMTLVEPGLKTKR